MADYVWDMPSPPIVRPNCWDRVIVPVHEVELVALHTHRVTVVTPVSLHGCSQWHVFAMFSCDPVATDHESELSMKNDARTGANAMYVGNASSAQRGL